MGKGAHPKSKLPPRKAVKPDQSKSGKQGAPKPKAKWSLKNEKDLVKFMVREKVRAGDSGNFKMAVFKEAAVYLATRPYEGAEKTGVMCKNKWTWLKKDFRAVCDLKNASRFSYSDKDGTRITEETESVWEAFIAKCPDAKPFKNKGWPHYDRMVQMMPVKAKSKNVFCPAHRDGSPEAEVEVSLLSSEEDTDDEDEVDELDGSEDIMASGDEESKDKDDDSDSDVELVEPDTAPTLNLATPGASQKRKSPAIPESAVKKPRPSHGAAALQGLKVQLEGMNTFLHTYLLQEMNRTGSTASAVPLTPQWKQLVMRRAQKLETHLDDDQLVSLLTDFKKDAGAADAYLVIERDGLRKAWVDKKLEPF